MEIFIKPVSLSICALITMALVSVANAGTDMDVKLGEQLYTQCTGCHSPDYNRTGPMHCGLLGRAAGGVKNFEYTKAMKESGIIWSRASLDKFLASPLSMIPGTSMGFSGIASEQNRQQLIAYLMQLDKNHALCN